MRIKGIEFKRKFPMDLNGVKTAINKDIEITLFDKKVVLNFNEPRSVIKYVPMPRSKNVTYEASNPLTAVVKDDEGYSIHYGNRHLTKLIPQYFDYKQERRAIKVNIDGKVQDVLLGSIIKVGNYLNVIPDEKMRVNAIGYVNRKHKDESGLNIRKKYFINQYSIDMNGNTYRVEVYDQNGKDKYAGMFLVEFTYLNSGNGVNIADTETPEKPPLSETGR